MKYVLDPHSNSVEGGRFLVCQACCTAKKIREILPMCIACKQYVMRINVMSYAFWNRPGQSTRPSETCCSNLMWPQVLNCFLWNCLAIFHPLHDTQQSMAKKIEEGGLVMPLTRNLRRVRATLRWQPVCEWPSLKPFRLTGNVAATCAHMICWQCTT